MKKLMVLVIAVILTAGCVTDSNNTDSQVAVELSTELYTVIGYNLSPKEQSLEIEFSWFSDDIPSDALIHVRDNIKNQGTAVSYIKGQYVYKLHSPIFAERENLSLELGIGIHNGKQLSLKSKLLLHDGLDAGDIIEVEKEGGILFTSHVISIPPMVIKHNKISIDKSNIPESTNTYNNLKLQQIYNDNLKAIYEVVSINDDKIIIEMGNLSAGTYLKYILFFDENNNSKVDDGEIGAYLNISSTDAWEKGVDARFTYLSENKDRYEVDYIAPNNPHIVYDLSYKPSPPMGFEERVEELGIGLVDFNYNRPIWIYPDTPIDKIFELFPGAEHSIEGSSHVFRFGENETVIVGVNSQGKIYHIYPRLTERFTIIGYPQLPWDDNTRDEIFSTHLTDASNGKGELFLSKYYGLDLTLQGMESGLRLDYSPSMQLVTGFIHYMPGFRGRMNGEGN